ncbi:hypothetical protein JOF56_002793 [Kibdelosporangium banguiense]|uniref:Uncharacterized protein n=1 Tax=Kibdelosporangium banguiense TaxID=1365924 RepID=A0ABS4TDB0_9PSEU|nr:hypothetical protein [Kibdelosporangium banguiense]MBP2322408.1 hypothetical protein [Kibdelosporangium banguiense]
MSYIKLVGHYVHQLPDHISVGNVGFQITLGNGTVVEFPAPFVPINPRLGIAPLVVPNGETGVAIDFSRWSPIRTGPDVIAKFPLNFSDQSMAVKVGRAFDADPATSWTDPVSSVTTWLRTWGPANGLTF